MIAMKLIKQGVFAAGDCTTVPYKQIIISTGSAKAALSAFDYLIRAEDNNLRKAKVFQILWLCLYFLL